MNRLNDKVVLVTGARRGIGKGIAELMTAEGAMVISADITPAAESNPRQVVLDVTSEASWQQLATSVRLEFGRLDVLINNAGVDVHKPAADTTLEEWRKVMAVNLEGVFLGCKIMYPLLVEAAKTRPAGGAVINMSSTLGISAVPDEVAYGTSKAGVRHLTKMLAIEWADPGKNVRVNSIHPGTIRTELLEQSALAWALHNTKEGTMESGLNAVAAMTPLQRIGRIEDVAYAALYLASDEAAYVTGIELVIDGGYLAR